MRPLRHNLALSSAIFLSACATTIPTQTEDPLTSAAAVMPLTPSQEPTHTNCAYLMRDLSIDWLSRYYWCSSPITEHSPEKTKVMLASMEHTRLRFAALREQMNVSTRRADSLVKKITAGLNQKTSIERNPPVIKSRASVTTTDRTHRIVFLPGREALGPKGRLQALNLLPVMRNARMITLRGGLIDGEFSLKDSLAAERRSVGRSLSVREFWRSSGLNVPTVTILHYSPDVSGSIVEVMIHD